MNKASLIEYIKQLLNILEKEEQDEFAHLSDRQIKMIFRMNSIEKRAKTKWPKFETIFDLKIIGKNKNA